MILIYFELGVGQIVVQNQSFEQADVHVEILGEVVVAGGWAQLLMIANQNRVLTFARHTCDLCMRTNICNCKNGARI